MIRGCHASKMRLRSLRMANDETLHTLFCYLSDQSTIVVVCIRFFSKSRNQNEAMNDKWVGGLGLDEFWEKGQKCKSMLHRCPWNDHPSQTFGESNAGLQFCALAQKSKCELIQLPARLVYLELRPKKAGWHKHPQSTRIFFQKLTSLPLCELGMSFQNQCCPSIWGHSLLRLPSSEVVLVPSAYICCSWFKLFSKKEGEALKD